jgi:WD40 repeat protein
VLADTNQPVAITGKSRSVGVQGMGGIGKTVLATALARDEEVKRAFPDGVIWITFGQTPQISILQSNVVKALGDKQASFTEINSGKTQLRKLLTDKACLLILDDVWNLNDAIAFDVLGERCQMLITTRDAGIITGLGGEEYQLCILNEQQALALLANWAEEKKAVEKLPAEKLPATALEVARECGYLPLALSMVGAIMQGKPINRWQNVLQKLRSADLEKIRQQFPDYPYPDLLKAIQVSVEALEPEERERYLDFAVFPEDTPIPEAVLQTFWEPLGLDEFDTQDVIDNLVRKSLASRDEKGNLSLHDLQLDYVRKQIPPTPLGKGGYETEIPPTPQHMRGYEKEDYVPKTPLKRGSPQAGGSYALSALHTRLLKAYTQKYPSGWHTLDNDGYIFQQLAYHFIEAGGERQLQRLLLDMRWLHVKLEQTNINELIADYNLLPEDKNLQLVQEALRLSTHILAEDKTQLPGQLLGRLLSIQAPKIQTLLQQAKQNKATWLRPVTASLTSTGRNLITTLTGHTGSVRVIALSVDGKYLISGSDDTTLKVWDWQTGVEVRTLTGHTGSVRVIALSVDGKYLISGSDDTTLKVWDWQTGVEVRTLTGHTYRVNAIALSADGKHLISGSYDKTLKVWDWQTGVEVRTLRSHSYYRVNAIALTPDDKYLISGSYDKTLKVWDWETGVEVRTLRGHTSGVYAITLSVDGKYLISSSYDKTLKVWNWQTGVEVRTLTGHTESVYPIALSVDGKYLISGSYDKTLKVWDWQTGVEVRTLRSHSSTVYAIALSVDGKYLISGSYDKTLKVWDWQTGVEVRTLTGHTDSVYAIALSVDGKYLISGSHDKTLKVWDWQTGVEVRTLTGHTDSVYAIALSVDGKYLISGSYDKTLKVWDWQTKVEVRTLRSHTYRVNAIALTPDGKYLISGSHDWTLIVWDWQTGVEVRTLRSHTSGVYALALTPDGKYLVSGSNDTTLKVWDWQTGVEVRTLRSHTSGVYALALTPDGKYLISGSNDTTLKVWDWQTGVEVRTLRSHNSRVNVIALTPDGKYLVSGSDDKTLKVWDWQTGEVIATFIGESPIRCCAVAGDGISIVAGDKSGRVHFLQLEGAR